MIKLFKTALQINIHFNGDKALLAASTAVLHLAKSDVTAARQVIWLLWLDQDCRLTLRFLEYELKAHLSLNDFQSRFIWVTVSSDL